MVVMMQKRSLIELLLNQERKLMAHYQSIAVQYFMEASVAFIVPKQFCAAAQC